MGWRRRETLKEKIETKTHEESETTERPRDGKREDELLCWGILLCCFLAYIRTSFVLSCFLGVRQLCAIFLLLLFFVSVDDGSNEEGEGGSDERKLFCFSPKKRGSKELNILV